MTDVIPLFSEEDLLVQQLQKIMPNRKFLVSWMNDKDEVSIFIPNQLSNSDAVWMNYLLAKHVDRRSGD